MSAAEKGGKNPFDYWEKIIGVILITWMKAGVRQTGRKNSKQVPFPIFGKHNKKNKQQKQVTCQIKEILLQYHGLGSKASWTWRSLHPSKHEGCRLEEFQLGKKTTTPPPSGIELGGWFIYRGGQTRIWVGGARTPGFRNLPTGERRPRAFPAEVFRSSLPPPPFPIFYPGKVGGEFCFLPSTLLNKCAERGLRFTTPLSLSAHLQRLSVIPCHRWRRPFFHIAGAEWIWLNGKGAKRGGRWKEGTKRPHAREWKQEGGRGKAQLRQPRRGSAFLPAVRTFIAAAPPQTPASQPARFPPTHLRSFRTPSPVSTQTLFPPPALSLGPPDG